LAKGTSVLWAYVLRGLLSSVKYLWGPSVLGIKFGGAYDRRKITGQKTTGQKSTFVEILLLMLKKFKNNFVRPQKFQFSGTGKDTDF